MGETERGEWENGGRGEWENGGRGEWEKGEWRVRI